MCVYKMEYIKNIRYIKYIVHNYYCVNYIQIDDVVRLIPIISSELQILFWNLLYKRTNHIFTWTTLQWNSSPSGARQTSHIYSVCTTYLKKKLDYTTYIRRSTSSLYHSLLIYTQIYILYVTLLLTFLNRIFNWNTPMWNICFTNSWHLSSANCSQLLQIS